MTQTPPTPPQLPASGEALYNAIMGPIEQELTFPAITQLAMQYQNETPEEKSMRLARYQKAFEEYARRYEEVRTKMAQGTRNYGREMMQYMENMWKDKEESILQDTAHRIANF